jgi:hypothetical protein
MSETTIIGALVGGLLSLGITDATAAATADQLSRTCAEYPSKTNDSVRCLSYISGVLDAYRTLNKLVPPRGRLFCITSSATPQAIIQVVKDDLQRHPEKLSMQAASVVLDAISDTFPCN